MKKFLLSLATIALASSFAMADDLCSVKFGSEGSVTQTSNSSYQDSWTAKDNTDTSLTWTITNFNNNKNGWTDMIKCGRKDIASIGSVATDFAIQGVVTDINLSISKFNEAGKVNAINVYSSKDGETWTKVATASESDYNTTTKILPISFTNTVANLYYKVDFDCASAKKNGVLWLSGITYVGTPATGDKEPAGLKFSASAVSVAQGEAFEAPVLTNPNNLPVSWTSSDVNVATVDNAGKVTIVGAGKTTITAAFEGNDKYAAGNAHYTLTVLGKANNINDLLYLCPVKDDQAIVNFPVTVVYVNGMSIYVIDAENNATLLYNNNSYAKGDIIPAGWTATYNLFNGLPEFIMSETPASTGTNEVTYPEVTSVGTMDVNKVVVLKGVTFAEATPATKDNFDGTLSDESTLLFRNNFTIASVEAGKYDVTCAVAIFKGTLQVYPIEYAAPVEAPTAPEQISGSSVDGTVKQGTVQGYPGLVFDLKSDTSTVTVKFDVPEGFTSWFIYDEEAEGNGEEIEPLTRAEESYWVSLSMLQSQIPYGVTGNEITLSTDKTPYYLTLIPVWGDQADYGNMYFAQVNIDHTVGVEAIEAADAAAEYYNLQGVRVLNPENGMYIKVVNGKSTKVIVK